MTQVSPAELPLVPDLDSLFGDGSTAEDYSDLPILLHVGPHKTGTTWLQELIIAPKDGKELIYCRDLNAIRHAIVMPPAGDFSPSRAGAIMKPHIERARAAGLPLLLMDEALAGRPFHYKYIRESNVLRLKKLFPKAKILITVREQNAVILSMYGEYLRFGYASRLEDFVAPEPADKPFHPILERSYYNYDRLLTLYETVYGADNVLVLPLEWMTRNAGDAVSRIAGHLGVTISPPDPKLAASRTNEAWTSAGRHVARIMNHMIAQDSRWNWQPGRIGRALSPMTLAGRVNKLSTALGQKASFQKEKAFLQEELGDYYAASNRRFAERIGFDLAALGYRCS